MRPLKREIQSTVTAADFMFRLALYHEHTAAMETELLQLLNLVCGTLYRSNCAIQTSPTDCFNDSWRDTLLGTMDTALCDFWYLAPEKKHYLLTYLLTYLRTYLNTHLLTYLLTYLLIYLLTYIHTYLLTYFTGRRLPGQRGMTSHSPPSRAAYILRTPWASPGVWRHRTTWLMTSWQVVAAVRLIWVMYVIIATQTAFYWSISRQYYVMSSVRRLPHPRMCWITRPLTLTWTGNTVLPCTRSSKNSNNVKSSQVY